MKRAVLASLMVSLVAACGARTQTRTRPDDASAVLEDASADADVQGDAGPLPGVLIRTCSPSDAPARAFWFSTDVRCTEAVRDGIRATFWQIPLQTGEYKFPTPVSEVEVCAGGTCVMGEGSLVVTSLDSAMVKGTFTFSFNGATHTQSFNVAMCVNAAMCG